MPWYEISAGNRYPAQHTEKYYFPNIAVFYLMTALTTYSSCQNTKIAKCRRKKSWRCTYGDAKLARFVTKNIKFFKTFGRQFFNERFLKNFFHDVFIKLFKDLFNELF